MAQQPEISPERAQREAGVRARSVDGDNEGAVEQALHLYGREVLSFLVALHRDESAAADVFSDFCEELWKALPGFRWQCSLRTWVYTLARRASWRYRHDGRRSPDRNVPLSQASAVSKLAAQMRSETASYLGGPAKDTLAAIREQLPPEDRELLVLRIDKDLPWNEVARVMLEEGESASDEVVKRESARLRKRFELAKKKLLELGRQHGLLPRKDGASSGG
jgi:RNA polymerase sigma-70 factor (ECF subfamily)